MSRFGKRRLSSFRFRFRPDAVRLEDRWVPATPSNQYVLNGQINPTGTVPVAKQDRLSVGDSYLADGARVNLNRARTAFAIKIDNTNVVDQLVGPGGILSGYNLRMWLRTDIAILTCPPSPPVGPTLAMVDNDARMIALEQADGVVWSEPVFHNPETDGWVVVTEELIIALREGVTAAEYFAGRPEFAKHRLLWGSTDQFVVTLTQSAGVSTLQLADIVAADPRVRFATPNFIQQRWKTFVPNDPLVGKQWHLDYSGFSGGKPDADVDAYTAWDITKGKGSVIAVIDDSFQLDHPDLEDSIFENPSEADDLAMNGMDDPVDMMTNKSIPPANNYIDDLNGWDFVLDSQANIDTGGDNDPSPFYDEDNHGTSVAGVAAATGNNKIGLAGIAYEAKILPIRIGLGPNFFSADAEIAAAVLYASGKSKQPDAMFPDLPVLPDWPAANVINCSWFSGKSTTITDAFTYAATKARGGKGVPTFISSGNFAEFLPPGTIQYPSNLSATIPGIVSVGGSTNLDVRSSYAQYGTALDFVGPTSFGSFGNGTLNIGTTDRPGNLGYSTGSFTGNFGGTSSSSPLAAGIGALILSVDPSLTADTVRKLMRNTTDLIGEDFVVYDNKGFNLDLVNNTGYGFGRVNANTAVRGVGTQEIQVLDGRVNIPDLQTGKTPDPASTVILQTEINTKVTKTFRIRNQGTSALTLSNLKISAGPATIGSFGAASLAVGESTTFTVTFMPADRGDATQTISFTNNDTSTTKGDRLNESAYDFKLRTIGKTPSIRGTVYEDLNNSGGFDSLNGDQPLQQWVVYADANNNGKLDQASDPFPSLNPPQPIPDFGTLSSPIIVSGFTSKVVDVNVKLNISHTWCEDLTVNLVSPGGDRVRLFSGVGSSSDNFIDTIIDDQAVNDITTASAPFTGTFFGQGKLEFFNGMPANGTWMLEVIDGTAGDTGVLNSWELVLSSGEQTGVSDATGAYTIFDLNPGSYNIRRVTQPGWIDGLEPTPNKYPVTIATTASTFTAKSFGQLKTNTVLGSFYNDANANGKFDMGETFLSGWKAYLDANNNGVFDTIEGPTTFTTMDIPQPILDGQTAKSAIEVSGVAGVVSDLNVLVNITHPFDGDLTINLRGPNDQVVTLAQGVGFGAADFIDTVFDDQAKTSITKGTAPFTGTFIPISPLAGLNTIDPNGTWTLEIMDGAAGDEGLLNNWTLTMTTSEVFGVSNKSGVYQINNLLAGDYVVRRVVQSGFLPTDPVSGFHNITIVDGQAVTGKDFGQTSKTPAGTPRISSLVIGDGTSQRSTVRSITVTFDSKVTLPPNPADAFTIVGDKVGSVTVMVDTSTSTPTQTIAKLTFSGAATEFASLKDDNYIFTVVADNITANGIPLDGNDDGMVGGDRVVAMHRLFGDADGNKAVNTADFTALRLAFGGDAARFDFDNDNDVDTADFSAFRVRFGSSLP